MCKINGHSIFTYMFQPWNASKLYNSNARAKETAAAQAEKEEAERKAAIGETDEETATVAKTNESKNKEITSLRVPLKTQGVGSNVSQDRVGLNLLGG